MPIDPLAPSLPKVSRPLTGRHVLVMLLSFFALIIGVNLTMMIFALRTMPGVDVKSVYEESQRYNGFLATRAAQDQRGWQVDVTMGDFKAAHPLNILVHDKAGQTINGLSGVLTLQRPTDKRLDQVLDLGAVGDGRYQAIVPPLLAGQWDMIAEFSKDGALMHASRHRFIVKD